jgi:HEAT repeat protein
MIAVAALILILGLAWWVLRPADTVRYQGKSVREWAAELYAKQTLGGTNDPAAAFVALGATAVPELRRLVHLREPFADKYLLPHLRRLPVKIRVYLLQKFKPGRTLEYRLGAIRALGIIGPEARAAIPDLLRAVQDDDARIRWVAAQTVSQLGPEAVMALRPLTTNANMTVRHAAVYALGEARTNALPALPQLLRASMDTNENVRSSSLYSIGRLGPAAFAPALAQSATNANPEMRAAAARSLLVILPPPGRVFPISYPITTNATEVRRLTLLSLARSRLTNDYAMAIYEAGFRDEDAQVRETARRAWALTTGNMSNYLHQRKINSPRE